MQKRREKPERLEMLRLRAVVVFVELIPFKVIKANVLDMFVTDDVIVLICKVTIGNIGITGRVTPNVTRCAVFTRR